MEAISRSESFVELLRARAVQQPDGLALRFLGNSSSEAPVEYLYSDLDARARAIAALLQTYARPGERAILLYPPGEDYVCGLLGCFYAGVIAVPAYPPDLAYLNRSTSRISAIVQNSGATLALTHSLVASRRELLVEKAAELGSLKWISTDLVDSTDTGVGLDVMPKGDDIAFLQYTSGSTGNPKGVIVKHRNILTNLGAIAHKMEAHERDSVVSWLPPYHDMGLIGGILWPLYFGVPCTLLSPISFLQRPMRWLRAISDYRATISVAPNFAYDLCVKKARKADLERLDLSSWRIMMSGAEPVQARTVRAFYERFAPTGVRWQNFQPVYGLAEATLMVSAERPSAPPRILGLRRRCYEEGRVEVGRDGEEDLVESVGCGSVLEGHTILIVDPETRRTCEPDQVGEIWVTGPSIADGYWNSPRDSVATFDAEFDGTPLDTTQLGAVLRTGDMGFIRGRDLFVSGRIRDMVILNGRNVYVEDVESSLVAHHADLRSGCGAVFGIETERGEGIVIAYEVRPSVTAVDELAAQMRRTVSEEHGLGVEAITLLKSKSVPKTTSGKIQRSACRQAFVAGRLPGVLYEYRRQG